MTEIMERERKTSVDSDSLGHPSSKILLLKMANDYSQYLKTDLSFQIAKVEEFVEESVAKLEEFRSLYELKDNERRTWKTHILPDAIRTGALLSITLNQRLDTLSCLILSIQSALDALEAQITLAEAKLGLPSPTGTIPGIKSVFKYFYKTEETGSDQSLPRNKVKKATEIVTFQQLRGPGPDPLQLAQYFH